MFPYSFTIPHVETNFSPLISMTWLCCKCGRVTIHSWIVSPNMTEGLSAGWSKPTLYLPQPNAYRNQIATHPNLKAPLLFKSRSMRLWVKLISCFLTASIIPVPTHLNQHSRNCSSSIIRNKICLDEKHPKNKADIEQRTYQDGGFR